MRIRGANSKKAGGMWMHKACPTEVARRKERKNEKNNKKAKLNGGK
jgi:hypothetical protein